MKQSTKSRSNKVLAQIAIFLGMTLMTFVPAYGQECDPSWYNPWSAPDAAVAKTGTATTAKATTAKKQDQQGGAKMKIKTVSMSQRATKTHAKTATRTRPS